MEGVQANDSCMVSISLLFQLHQLSHPQNCIHDVTQLFWWEIVSCTEMNGATPWLHSWYIYVICRAVKIYPVLEVVF